MICTRPSSRVDPHFLLDPVEPAYLALYRSGELAERVAAGLRELENCCACPRNCHVNILTMQHCVALQCLMNGSNHQEERDRRPLQLCPVCLRKLCWNLETEPVGYMKRLEAFCRRQHLDAEVDWYEQALAALSGDRSPA